MKKCPQCGTEYSDVTLSFCLHDGTPLIVAAQGDAPTVVLGETETVVPRRDAIRVPLAETQLSWGQSESTRVAVQPERQPEKKTSNTALAVGLTVVGMLLLFGIIGIAAIVFLRNSEEAKLPNTNITPNKNVNGPGTNYATPDPPASPMRTPPSPTPASTPQRTPDEPPPKVLASYPSTTRLRFSRGAYSTSFSGDINPGDTRSLVLACRSGQSLSANISGSGCVNIRGGGSSYRTTTSGGDNYVTIVSTCSSVARFTITVSVI